MVATIVLFFLVKFYMRKCFFYILVIEVGAAVFKNVVSRVERFVSGQTKVQLNDVHFLIGHRRAD